MTRVPPDHLKPRYCIPHCVPQQRDKSPYVIGYRLHSQTAIDAKTGHSFPLVSLLAPANHHDSHLLPFLVKLGLAMEIDLRLVTCDATSMNSEKTAHATG